MIPIRPPLFPGCPEQGVVLSFSQKHLPSPYRRPPGCFRNGIESDLSHRRTWAPSPVQHWFFPGPPQPFCLPPPRIQGSASGPAGPLLVTYPLAPPPASLSRGHTCPLVLPSPALLPPSGREGASSGSSTAIPPWVPCPDLPTQMGCAAGQFTSPALGGAQRPPWCFTVVRTTR